MLTIEEVCDRLQLKTSFVYDWVEAGKMPHIKVGHLLRFREEDLAIWLDSLLVVPKGEAGDGTQARGENDRDEQPD